MTSRVVACGLLLAACGEGEVPVPDTCNGHVELCPRAFDAVSYPTTHNAMSNAEDEFVNPNQRYGLRRQLDDGIRAMMIDVYDEEGSVYLCHSICDFGKTELVSGLRAIDAFLDDHRGEVISLLVEDHAVAANLEAPFRESGILARTRVQAVGAPWPTLRELIDADERVIVFAERQGGAFPWFHDLWAFSWETPFSFYDVGDFTCEPNRGDPANSLFTLNHFLTRTFGGEDLAQMANPLLGDRARQCMTESGRLPNFVTVDFYDVGDLFGVVDGLNGF